MKTIAYVILLSICAVSVYAQTVVVVPPQTVMVPRADTAKPLRDLFQSFVDQEERQKQRDHELQMQREWLAVQQAIAASARPAAPAVTGAQMYTSGLANGLGWIYLSSDAQFLYLTGFMDAASIQGSSFADLAKQCQCDYANIRNGVSEFYRSNPAYVRVPIAAAIKLHLMKATGTTDQVLNAEAARMASLTAQHP